MLEARSPLGAHARFDMEGLGLSEAPGFKLTQISASERIFKRELGEQVKFGTAWQTRDRTVFQINAKQAWVLGEELESNAFYVTPLSSSRCRIAVEGEKSRKLLSACAPIDFEKSVFKPRNYVMTGIHHTPVLIHCARDDGFHIYAMRTFALSVWDWLVDAAKAL